jgi:hypothetical protein
MLGKTRDLIGVMMNLHNHGGISFVLLGFLMLGVWKLEEINSI